MAQPSFGGFGRGGMRFRRCHGCWRGPLTQLETPLDSSPTALADLSAPRS
jgi:hypothetical protein